MGPSPADDELRASDVMRLLDRVERDVREDIADVRVEVRELRKDLATLAFVDWRRYDHDMGDLRQRLDGHDQRFAGLDEGSRVNWRLVLTSLVAPLLVALLTAAFLVQAAP